MIIKIKKEPEKKKGKMKKMKKYLSSIYVSKNSTPSMVTIAELNYGRTKQHKLRSHWSDHFFLDLFQENTHTHTEDSSVLFCASVQSNWRQNQMVLYIQPKSQTHSIIDGQTTFQSESIYFILFFLFLYFSIILLYLFCLYFHFLFFLDLLVYWVRCTPLIHRPVAVLVPTI